MGTIRVVLRRVLNLLTALSLLLCVAAVALWIRSYYRSDGFGYAQRCSEAERRSDYWVYSTRGRMTFITALLGLPDKEIGPFWNSGLPDDPYRMEETGFYLLGWNLEQYPSYATVSAPHWALAMLLGVAPAAAALTHFRRIRRQTRDRCRSCGYDLRATPERCPECGSPGNNLAASSPSSR